jgi:hypothetical protein
MARRKGKPSTVERPIYFARAYLDGAPDPAAAPKVARLVPTIDAMPFTFGQRYGGTPDSGRWPCMWVDRPTTPSRIELAWLTDRDLPGIEEQGRVSPLALRSGQHVHYPTHMVMFDGGILGVEYWKPGPGPWVLAKYLNERGYPGRLSFDWLYKPETLTELLRIGEFRALQIRIPVSRSAALAARDERLGGAIQFLQRIGDDVVVDLRLSPEAKRGPLQGLADIVRHIARFAKGDGVTKLEVVGYDAETNERITLDLLNPRIMQKREMVLLGDSNKAVEKDSACRAIERTFEQQRQEILDAAGHVPQ